MLIACYQRRTGRRRAVPRKCSGCSMGRMGCARVMRVMVRVVRVVPTRGIAEALACLMSYDPQSSAEVNVANMTDTADAVVTGEVTQAVRESSSSAGPIAVGDWLGISRDGIVGVQPTTADAAIELLDRLVTHDHELLTVIAGTDADDDTTERIETWMAEHHAEVEVEVHQGGQPLYPYYFGLE